MKKPKNINRRQFLIGSGGFMLAIPTLPSLLPSALATPQNRVSRFVSIGRKDGVPLKFFPKVNYNELTQLGETMRYMNMSDISGNISNCFGEKFNELKEHMLFLRSINGMETSGDHGSNSILTAVNLKNFPDRVPSIGLYHSIDKYIIDKIYQETPFEEQLNINMSWSSSTASYSIRNTGNNNIKRLPAYLSPKSIFDAYFSQGGNQESDSSKNEILAIDKVIENLRSVRNGRKISSNDKITLDKFSEEIFEAQSKLKAAQPLSCNNLDQIDNGSNLKEKIELTFKVMSLVLKCDRTRVINFSFNPDTLIKPYFGGKFHHGESHSTRAENVAIFEQMHKWHNDFMADFILELNEEDPLNPGTKYLDNTLIFNSNEIGSQSNGNGTGTDNNHLRVDVPCVLFGNVNDYFKTGRYIDYRNSNSPKNNRWWKPVGHPYNQVLTTIMNAFGVSHTEWEISNTPGYGDYRGQKYNKSHPDIMSLGNKRDPLPFIKKAS